MPPEPVATPTGAPAEPPPAVLDPAVAIVAPPIAIVRPPLPPEPAAAPPPAQTVLPLPGEQVDPEDAAEGAKIENGLVSLPQSSFKGIKTRAANKARKEYETKMLSRAHALGFASIDEMFETLEQETDVADPNDTTPLNPDVPPATPAAAPPARRPAPAAAAPVAPRDPVGIDPKAERALPASTRKRLNAVKAESQQKVQQAQERARAAEAQSKQTNSQLEAFRAEQGMRETLIRAGVSDVDYTHHELRKHMTVLAADKTPEGEAKIKAFTVEAWAEEQKKARPYLFGQQPVPANTGVHGQPPPAQAPGAIAASAAAAGAFDARTATPAELKQRYAGVTTVPFGPARS